MGRAGIGFWVVEHDGAIVGIAGVRPPALARPRLPEPLLPLRGRELGRGFATEAVGEAVAVARGARPVLARTRSDVTDAQSRMSEIASSGQQPSASSASSI